MSACAMLAQNMSVVCMADATCRAKYVVRPGSESDAHMLARDIDAIIRSHGFTNAACAEIAPDIGDIGLLVLARELSVACADPRDVASAKSTLYVNGLIAVCLACAVAAFLALFVINGAHAGVASRVGIY